jgi:hypothetical protein
VTAQILLRVTLFYLALYSLYFILKSVHDRHTALVTSLLLGCHAFFIGAMGWDYIDGFGIAYYLLTVALLTRSHSAARPQLWIAFAGAGCAACFFTNPIWLLVMPFLPFYYLVPAWTKRTESLCCGTVVFLKSYAIGFAALTFLLGGVNYLAVRNFWFYSRSLHIIGALNAIPEWNGQDFAWIARATWIVFPVITFIAVIVHVLRTASYASLAYFFRNRFAGFASLDVFTVLFHANFLYCFLALCYLTFIQRHRVLELEYYANILIAPMFLALGSGILALPKNLNFPLFFKTLAVATVICLVPLWTLMRYTDLLAMLPFIRQHNALFVYYLVLPTLVGSGALVMRVCFPSSFTIWRLSVMTLALAGIGLIPEYTACIWNSSYHGPAMYSRVAHAIGIIRMQSSLTQPPFFWFDCKERNTFDYNAICTSLRGHGSFANTFPTLSPTTMIPPESLIVILAENKDIPSAADEALRQIGLRAERVSQVRIANKGASYWMSFLRATKISPNLAARR